MIGLVLRHEPGAAGSEIYRVWNGEERVGTILQETVGLTTFWQWSISGIEESGLTTVQKYGREDSRDEAAKAFRAAFERIMELPHHRPGEYPHKTW
ncbi:hypothetical protein [Kaistia sp. MMO-174]|uniref:hypothetical protein n=1 Tax=Kaistia sp. MMO-174 TaxID=3081256 RepID=UPI003019AFED